MCRRMAKILKFSIALTDWKGCIILQKLAIDIRFFENHDNLGDGFMEKEIEKKSEKVWSCMAAVWHCA